MRLRFAKAVVGALMLAFSATAAAGPAPAAQAAAAPAQGLRTPDVIYVPTRQTVVDAMLKAANVKAGDVLYDLGCGDGRIPVTAAKLGARAVCIDIDPKRIAEANENVKKAGVGDRVRVLNQDLFTTDISEATVVSLYLLPTLNMKLRPTLWKTLKPGTRIVSHDFDMGDWKPEKTIKVGTRTVYFWTIPDAATAAKIGKTAAKKG
jgi:2-polyprenyl-3-methyl-5-hydroxy-6-metoxy-1,4-benzoquinol methylase